METECYGLWWLSMITNVHFNNDDDHEDSNDDDDHSTFIMHIQVPCSFEAYDSFIIPCLHVDV